MGSAHYNEWINSDNFKGVAEEIINRELDALKGEDASDYRTKIESINEVYSLDLAAHLEKLEILEREYDEYIDHQIDMHNDREFDDYTEENVSEEVIITEIFNSLKD